MTGMFLVDPRLHTFLRALAAFVVAPYLMLIGHQHNLPGVLWIGIITFLVDAALFFKSIQLLPLS